MLLPVVVTLFLATADSCARAYPSRAVSTFARTHHVVTMSSPTHTPAAALGWCRSWQSWSPWARNFVSSAVMGGLADCAAQILARGINATTTFDPTRTLLFAAVSGATHAPLSKGWSMIRSRLALPHDWSSLRRTAALTLLDQAFGATLSTVAFLIVFAAIGSLAMPKWKFKYSKVTTVIREALTVHWLCWPTVHFVNLLLLPARFSPWLLNSFGFLWQAVLSYIGNTGLSTSDTATNPQKLLFLADNLVPMFSFSGVETLARVTDVHDGDTCKVVFNIPGTQDIRRFTIRLQGLDTPEITSNDEVEKKKAVRARNRLLNWLSPKEFDVDGDYSKKEILDKLKRNEAYAILKIGDFDKYGRLLGTLFKNSHPNEVSINEILVRENFAKPYDGGTKDTNWS